MDNIQLRCRAHNAYEAEQYFGSLLLREGQQWTRAGASASGMDWHLITVSGFW